MIRTSDIEMELEEGDDYLRDGRWDLAKSKFNLTLVLLAQLTKSVAVAGKFGGAIAGATVADILEALRGGVHHPILDTVIGGALGYAVGKIGSKHYTNTLNPYWVRAYIGLGDSCRYMNDFDAARACYKTSLLFSPNDQSTINKIAEVTI